MTAPKRRPRIFTYIFEHVSSRNPFEAFMILYFTFTGFSWVFLDTRPGEKGISEVISTWWPFFWNATIMVFGTGVLISYFLKDFLVQKLLKIWCLIGISGACVSYGVTLLVAYGSHRSLSWGWLVLLGLCALARAGQAGQEVIEYRQRLRLYASIEGDEE